MAIFCNSHTLLYYSLSIFCLLFPLTKSLTFNLTDIGPQHLNDITTFGDAYISSQGLQVTSDQHSNDSQQKAATSDRSANDMQLKAGKATYVHPLHLWNSSTGNLTGFNTHFTFAIDSSGSPNFADGLAFFLAPAGSNFRAGGAMGLPIDLETMKPTSSFVAVEFDTFQNDWDPVNISPVTHVGINVNSLTSNVSAVWYCDITQGIENKVWIRYDSISMNLSVVLTDSTNTTRMEDNIHLIVDMRDYLPEWVTFGFSAATGSLFQKNNVKSWEFSSSFHYETNKNVPSKVIPRLNNETNTNIPAPVKPGREKRSPGVLVGLIVGSCVLVGGLALVGFGLWKRHRAKEEGEFEFEMSMENEFESGSGPKKFSYDQLSRATKNFKEEHKLGEGGFGGVYRGFLRELNSYIAVKKISKGSKQGIKEYASEVKVISRLRHRNLVQLFGWCHEKKELLLVYEFMENGSLDLHLFKGKSLLTWGTRYKVTQGLASALLYLHEEWEQCVVHRDIKSSNVMLDSNFNAKLGDFGLARFVNHEKGSQTTVLAGTMGYLAPECGFTYKASKEADVYSFGIVALEIACGRKPLDFNMPENQIKIVEWVWDLYGMGKLLEAVDPKLSMDFDEREMERLMIVGLWCAHPDQSLRATIKQAIHVLTFEAALPNLPQKMPGLTFEAAKFDSSQNQYLTSSCNADKP